MIHLCFGRKVVVFLIGIAVGLFIVVWGSSAQEGALTTFSGRVIDELGNPVAGCTVAVKPVVDGNGAWFVIRRDNQLMVILLPMRTGYPMIFFLNPLMLKKVPTKETTLLQHSLMENGMLLVLTVYSCA